jgi:phosphoenolpyruvate synthase/pyruvate phosphate dikinase
MLHPKIKRSPWILAFAAAVGLVVWGANAHLDRAIAGDDHVRTHRYHRMSEEEKQQLHETLENAMEAVHEALAGAFEGLEIDVDLGDLDLDSEEFEEQMEEFGERMEAFGQRMSERMEALGERFDRDGTWNWSSDSHRGSGVYSGDRDADGLRDEIRDLREQIRKLERELDEQRENEGI